MDRRKFHKTISQAAIVTYLAPFNKLSMSGKKTFLQKGDRVSLICPGSPITNAQLNLAVENIKKLDLEPVYDDRLLLEHGYLAGKDGERVDQIHEALEDDSIKALWAVRGGYGCTRLLPLLKNEILRTHPKPIIGYSDITALLMYWDQVGGCPALHAPVLKESWSSKQLNVLKKVLFSEKVELNFNEAQQLQGNAPKLTGQMTGGNLSVLAALCGTSWEWNIEDKIIFLEDVGEEPYRIDRMLHQLHQSENFHQAKAFLLGGFTDCSSPVGKPSFSTTETLKKFFGQFDCPVWFNVPFGHIAEQIVLPVNTTVQLEDKNLKWDYI